MKILIFLGLWLTIHAYAQKSLSPQVFQGNVRPVLSGIVNDFYQMISHFPDYPKAVIGIVEEMENMEEIKEALRTKCPHFLNEECQVPLDELRKKLSSIESQTLKLWTDLQPATTPYLTNMVGARIISQFMNELTYFKGGLDNASLLLRGKIKEPKGTFVLIKKLDDLATILSLAIVEFVPFQYKEDFRSFYFNFVHPIETHIAKSKNYEFLNRNVNQLNFSINLLNQNLTKRNKKTPEGMAPYLSLIHNRWNSLLRYYF